jgi:hypothetical protein
LKPRRLFAVVVLVALAALVLAGPVTAAPVHLSATLNGQNEVNDQGVPGQGDPDGTGTADITLIPKKSPKKSKICFDITVSNIDTATAAHIHEGPEGQNGPVKVTLTPPGTDGKSSDCVKTKRALIKEIKENPSGYYVNVHNEPYPNGAIRGQLHKLK